MKKIFMKQFRQSKRLLCLMLVLCMLCCTGINFVYADTDSEAKITSPGNGDWLDPTVSNTVKWTTPSSGLTYKITIKNDVTGFYVVKNKQVSGNSYTISADLLDNNERYIIWVGTFSGSTATGRGDQISVCMNGYSDCKTKYKEATISYPSNGQEISAGENLNIKISGQSGLAYRLIVKNTTSGETVAEEDELTKTSYTVSSSKLKAGNSYAVWLGTFKKNSAEKKEFGAGHRIVFSVKTAAKEPEPEYNPAEITSPSDMQWLDPQSDITVKWNKPASGLEYCISVKDDVTGKVFVSDKYTTSTSYTIKANTLIAEQRYLITLTTYADGEKVGSASQVRINMNGIEYEEAGFAYPSDGAVIDASEKIEIRLSNTNDDYVYKISIVDTSDNTSLISNHLLNNNKYIIYENAFDSDKKLKVWVGTYLPSDTDTAIGRGSTIYFTVKKRAEETTVETASREAVFTSPEADAVVDYQQDLTLEWEEADIDTYYSLTVKDLTTDDFFITETLTGSSYTIKASKLTENHFYKASILTYTNADKKDYVGLGNEVFFSTNSESTPCEIKSLTADIFDDGLTFEYQISGDSFGYAAVVITDSHGNTVYNKNHYEASGKAVISADDLNSGGTYTCEVRAYDSNGQNVAAKAQKYTVAESGFSLSGVKKPEGKLTYKNTFSIQGVVSSAYPIEKAVIAIYEKSNPDYPKSDIISESVNGNFDIGKYDGVLQFEKLEIGEYIYKVTVTDSIGESKTVIQSDFSIGMADGTYLDVPAAHPNADAIKELSLRNVLAGDGTGYFRPDDSITRAEFVKVICVAFGLKMTSASKTFDDVQSHWGKEYIYKAASNGLVNGVDDRNFAPDDKVTYQQIAKIVTILKGWDSSARKLGGYPDGYVKVMISNKLFDESTMEMSEFRYTDYYNKFATRADVSQIVYNAILHSGEDKTVISEPIDANKVSFEEVLKETAAGHYGNTYEEYVSSDDIPWCVYCATKIARDALKAYGLSDDDANNIIPYGSSAQSSTAYLIKYYKRDQYHNYTTYTSDRTGIQYNQLCFTSQDYIPKIGDFVVVETDSTNSGPDHTELIVDVNEENLTFITIAGNTSSGPTVSYKDYVYNSNKNRWERKGSSSTFVHGFVSPDYPD